MALLKVKEDKDLMRDSVSNAILSTNNNELERYRQRKAKSSEYEEAINDINNIKSELSEIIKSLLTQLVGK
jgi:hypothetical protein